MPNERNITSQRIVSGQNPRVKFAIKLRNRSRRNRTGLFIVEGYRECLRALGGGVAFESLFFCPKFFRDGGFGELVQRISQRDVDAFELSDAAFEKISARSGCDGILAICKAWESNLSELKVRENSLFLVVDGIEKSGNLGALMRSAESANVDAMIVCDPVTDIFNHNAVRTSQGALFSLPIFQVSRGEAHNFLVENGISIVVTSPSAPVRYWEIDMRHSSAVVMGAERDGLPEFWLRSGDVTAVSIPQLGRSDSLNVNDAAVVLLYDAIRQRLSRGAKHER
jgi:TrmH family RNA methyltransferase